MSISKSFTAVAILILVDRGEIGLDDPIIDYLPGLAQFGSQLTIRHLLRHTSWVDTGAAGRWLPSLLVRRLGELPLTMT